jgi:hypothetical protein
MKLGAAGSERFSESVELQADSLQGPNQVPSDL